MTRVDDISNLYDDVCEILVDVEMHDVYVLNVSGCNDDVASLIAKRLTQMGYSK